MAVGFTTTCAISAYHHTTEGEALFAFSSNTGNLLLVKMPPVDVDGGKSKTFILTFFFN
jgi:hypothetical protein